LLSKYPIDASAVRTFRNFRWADMPGAQLPDDPRTDEPADWYSDKALSRFPLSSKSHWDVPLLVNGTRIHVLAAHPTPPVFDGVENRNGRRNRDEIRFWVDYVGPPERASYIYDDQENRGGLDEDESFVVLGDLNGDPNDGEGSSGIRALLDSSRVQGCLAPASGGGAEQAREQGKSNRLHRGDPSQDTVDAADDPGPGNLRLDYVLPSDDLCVVDSGVFWPTRADPDFALVGVHPFPSSDHRLVWVDVRVPASRRGETKPSPPSPK
ncbi:MAG: endonuclease/exonuclease/phosphatase family protein, partial [Planctomycetota bacterium]